MSVLPDPTNAYNNGYEAGAKSERERIAEIMADGFCLEGTACICRHGNKCLEHWLVFLEADE